MDDDAGQLRALAIGHHVLAVVTALVSCVFIPFVTAGLAVIREARPDSTSPIPDELFGWLFVLLGATFVLLGWVFAWSLYYMGRCLTLRTHHTFCVITAAMNCLFFPFGTVLGVFALIVLMRPSVKALFQAGAKGGPMEGLNAEGRGDGGAKN